MKKVTIILTGVILMTIGTLSVKAQVTATASTSATIYTPIAIAKQIDMNFGNVAVSPTLAGTVELTPAGLRTKTGGVTLPNLAGTVAAAKFKVTGESGTTYSISLPSSPITLTKEGSTSVTMTVGTFTSTPTPSGTLTGGTEDVFVGATLNVAAGQASGLYSNASDLFVTVNYN